MKKYVLGIFMALFCLSFGTSCKSSKNCKGGSWYGNRNLGYEMPQLNKNHHNVTAKQIETKTNVTDCETVAP